MADLDLICEFVNTVDLEQGRDELAAWLVANHGRPADAVQARAVREALRELLRSNNGVGSDLAAPSKTLDEAARRERLRVGFHDGSIALMVRDGDPAGPVARVLGAVASAMADGSWLRLKACRSDTCRWAFVDGARNHSRQWCDMRVCGNRQKVRTFRTRHA